MRRGGAMVLLLGLTAAAWGAEPMTVVVADEGGAAGRVGAPASVVLELSETLLGAAKAGRLCLTEVGAAAATPIPAQFEPAPDGGAKGTLWWLMPPGAKGSRRFELGVAAQPPKAAMAARLEKNPERVVLAEGERPALQYCFGTVPVPEGVGGKYAVARSDYIHPLYGPAGEVLTTDYAKDHPHHRGLYWAWPEVTYKGGMHDIHALQGVFARPVKLLRRGGGPVLAVVAGESRWMWEDTEPIVLEVATIRAFAATGGRRLVDLEFRLTALADGVAIARRGQKAYGGFNLRFSRRQGQVMRHRNAAKGAPLPLSWAHIAGVPPGANEPIGVAILQHQANPRYPGDWVKYPNLNWLQPTFPSKGERFPLSRSEPLVLRFRLCVHTGEATEATLADLWTAYNRPPRVAAANE